jgi:hypothetical protein
MENEHTVLDPSDPARSTRSPPGGHGPSRARRRGSSTASTRAPAGGRNSSGSGGRASGVGSRPGSWWASPTGPPTSPRSAAPGRPAGHRPQRRGPISPALAFQTMRPQPGNGPPTSSSCPATRPPPGTTGDRPPPLAHGQGADRRGRGFRPGRVRFGAVAGSRASWREWEAAHRGLRRYTGLPADLLRGCDLRGPARLFEELLRHRARSAASTPASSAATPTHWRAARPRPRPCPGPRIFTAAGNREPGFDGDLVTSPERARPTLAPGGGGRRALPGGHLSAARRQAPQPVDAGRPAAPATRPPPFTSALTHPAGPPLS